MLIVFEFAIHYGARFAYSVIINSEMDFICLLIILKLQQKIIRRQ